jgi:hypothetical protein
MHGDANSISVMGCYAETSANSTRGIALPRGSRNSALRMSASNVIVSNTSLVNADGFFDPEECKNLVEFDWYDIFTVLGVEVPVYKLAKLKITDRKPEARL